jgi:hypothetical protein
MAVLVLLSHQCAARRPCHHELTVVVVVMMTQYALAVNDPGRPPAAGRLRRRASSPPVRLVRPGEVLMAYPLPPWTDTFNATSMEKGWFRPARAGIPDGALLHGWTVNRCFISADGTPQDRNH